MRDAYTSTDLYRKTEAHDEFNDTLWEYRAAAIKSHVGALPILDVGCGPGKFLKYLAKGKPFLLAIPSDLYGVEPDHDDVMAAYAALPTAHITECRFEDYRTEMKFGTIIASHVLEHVDNSIDFLRKCREILAPDGTLIITVPNALALHKRLGALMDLGELYGLSATACRERHQRTFDRTKLESTIWALGFDIQTIEGLMLKPLPSAMMQETLSKKFADAFNEIGKDPALIDYCSSLMVVARRRG